MIETSSTDEILQHLIYHPHSSLETQSMEAEEDISLSFPLLTAISNYLIFNSNRLNSNNAYAYLEVVKLLLTMLATQLETNLRDLNSKSPASRQPFLELLTLPQHLQMEYYGESIDAPKLMSVLLDHVIARRKFVKTKPGSTAATGNDEPTNDARIDIEGGVQARNNDDNVQEESAWSAFYELGKFFAFPFQEFARMLMTGDTDIHLVSDAPLADLCIFPLLIIVNYQNPMDSSISNSFRSFLAGMNHNLPPNIISQDDTSSSTLPSSSSSSSSTSSPIQSSQSSKEPNFTKLYQTIISRISEDSMLLLLYMLLQTNQNFHMFLASRANLDVLLLPLLSTLNRAHESTRLRVYTILIILTILSFDEHFIQSIQSVVIPTPPWYKETFLPAVPLPEFITLVLLRTINLNIRGIRDPYLHDNCLACIGNLGPQLTALQLFTSKKLIHTTQLFVLRYTTMLNKSSSIASITESARIASLKRDDDPSEEDSENYSSDDETSDYDGDGDIPSSSSRPQTNENDHSTIEMGEEASLALDIGQHAPKSGLELIQSLEATEGYIRTLLEVIDCLFRKKPSQHLMIIYAMILEQNQFNSLITHPRLSNLVNHLRSCAEFFLQAVQKVECFTPSQVIGEIAKATRVWKIPQDPPLSDLKFSYQETNASEFFTPSIWKIVLKSQYFYWNPLSIRLFDTGSDPSYAGDDHPDDPPRTNLPENV
jgi:hypothetical protein